jgi:hypothetical protein
MTAADLSAFARKHLTGTICLGVTLVAGGLIYFRSGAVIESQTLYEAKSAEAAKMLNNVKAAPGLEEQVAEILELGKDLDDRLVNASQLAVNLQYFYKLEADNGVKLLDVRQTTAPRPARGAAKTLFAPVPFSLSVQGTYAQLLKFLGELQNGRHLCRINTAAFNKPGGIGGADTSATQEITLTLSIELLGQS